MIRTGNFAWNIKLLHAVHIKTNNMGNIISEMTKNHMSLSCDFANLTASVTRANELNDQTGPLYSPDSTHIMLMLC